MSERMVMTARDKNKRIWTVKSFTVQHESPIEAARIAHAQCDEYTEQYAQKHSDSFQKVALMKVEVKPVLVFSPFDEKWICMVSATFEAMIEAMIYKKRSRSNEPLASPVTFDGNMELVPLDEDAEREYSVLVH